MDLKYFIDTEFIEDGRTIDLISIGIACEDGREFYAVSTEADLTKASPWVRENVLVHLPPYGNRAWMSRTEIRRGIESFVTGRKRPEFWAYYADYDWVAFCQLFGTMMDLPTYMPKFCMDLKQLAVSRGNPQIPKQADGEHHALADARWNRDAYRFLMASTPT